MHIYKICTLLIFYEELVKFFIGPKVLVIGPFHFLRSNIYFRLIIIWYELYSNYLVLNESKMSLCFSSYKMVFLKYCRVQISNELSCLNHNYSTEFFLDTTLFFDLKIELRTNEIKM